MEYAGKQVVRALEVGTPNDFVMFPLNMYVLNRLSPGVQPFNRIGERVHMSHLAIRGHLYRPGPLGVTLNPDYVRFMIVYTKEPWIPYGSVGYDADQLLQGVEYDGTIVPAHVFTGLNPNSSERFEVILDETRNIAATVYHSNMDQDSTLKLDFDIPLDHPAFYSRTAPDPTSGELALVCISLNAGGWNCKVTCTLDYDDV